MAGKEPLSGRSVLKFIYVRSANVQYKLKMAVLCQRWPGPNVVGESHTKSPLVSLSTVTNVLPELGKLKVEYAQKDLCPNLPRGHSQGA